MWSYQLPPLCGRTSCSLYDWSYVVVPAAPFMWSYQLAALYVVVPAALYVVVLAALFMWSYQLLSLYVVVPAAPFMWSYQLRPLCGRTSCSLFMWSY